MRVLILAILLVGAPFAAAETGPESTEDDVAPTRASGPLSPAEERFQGDWLAHGIVLDRVEYSMTFEGRDFRARAFPDDEDRDERYEGYIAIRTDVEPARIDFVVLDASGKPGRISKGIFRFDGETILLKAPEHGLPRPGDFDRDFTGPIAFLRLSRDR